MDTTKTSNLIDTLVSIGNHKNDIDSIMSVSSFLSSDSAEYQFENTLGESYALRREGNTFRAGYPARDYSGDPTVTKMLNWSIEEIYAAR